MAVTKKKLFLIEWDAPAAATRAAALEKAGWSVEIESVDGAIAWTRISESDPDVVAVDLTRLPSHGREAARVVRMTAATRHIPIVFIDGTAEAQAKALGVVPGAHHVTGDDLAEVLSKLAH